MRQQCLSTVLNLAPAESKILRRRPDVKHLNAAFDTRGITFYLLDAVPSIVERIPNARFVFLGDGPDAATFGRRTLARDVYLCAAARKCEPAGGRRLVHGLPGVCFLGSLSGRPCETPFKHIVGGRKPNDLGHRTSRNYSRIGQPH